MTLESLSQMIPKPSNYNRSGENPCLEIDDLVIYQIDDLSFDIDGYSRYEKLPRLFEFATEEDVVAYLIPFILQCLDGQERV